MIVHVDSLSYVWTLNAVKCDLPYSVLLKQNVK